MEQIYKLNLPSGAGVAGPTLGKQSITGMKVALFLAIGLFSLGFVSHSVKPGLFGLGYYSVFADFQTVDGLREGAQVEIAGVRIGEVERIFLAPNEMARVEMRLREDIMLPEDTIAAIGLRGLLGDKVVRILPGGSPRKVPASGTLQETESGVDLADLVSKMLVGGL
ncbi:MAG: outer membrane lipid asymmetry maintenance protein MlaD [Nitrospinae bacterium CG11_big_fil_rev_8_21_14_0_20_56_8]|nr:MAG: outer membrane lipid asymmetry maintenance protein MlaD [Nitrospinae bacterium CG11_big_fil_rev_8_21_14_0_20_56_8]